MLLAPHFQGVGENLHERGPPSTADEESPTEESFGAPPSSLTHFAMPFTTSQKSAPKQVPSFRHGPLRSPAAIGVGVAASPTQPLTKGCGSMATREFA